MSTATQVQLRRGTAAQVAAFTGAPGEVTPDMTNKRLYLHDGVTPGGVPQASLADVNTAVAGVSAGANAFLQWLTCT
jgi:hypothetical protein